MLGALVRRLAGRMQRKAEKGEPAHARQRRRGLRLRGHAAAEGFAAGNQRKRRQKTRGFSHRRAHRGLRELRRIGALAARLHIRKLIAQARDAALGKFARDRRHERMRHAGAGAVREHVTSARLRRRKQQAGDALRLADCDGDGFWFGRSHRSRSRPQKYPGCGATRIREKIRSSRLHLLVSRDHRFAVRRRPSSASRR